MGWIIFGRPICRNQILKSKSNMQVETLLKYFRSDIDNAARAFFLWKGINHYAIKDKGIYEGISNQALIWNTITYGLQTTFFIVLGRLFDTDGTSFSVHTFLRNCVENIEQFSKDSLRKRKINLSHGVEHEWLDGYIKTAYVPVEADFVLLKSELKKHQKQFEKIYRPIRNMIVAHRDIKTLEPTTELFGNTKSDDIQNFLFFLHQIYEIVWELLNNGRLTKIDDHKFDEEDYIIHDLNALMERLRIDIQPSHLKTK